MLEAAPCTVLCCGPPLPRSRCAGPHDESRLPGSDHHFGALSPRSTGWIHWSASLPPQHSGPCSSTRAWSSPLPYRPDAMVATTMASALASTSGRVQQGLGVALPSRPAAALLRRALPHAATSQRSARRISCQAAKDSTRTR